MAVRSNREHLYIYQYMKIMNDLRTSQYCRWEETRQFRKDNIILICYTPMDMFTSRSPWGVLELYFIEEILQCTYRRLVVLLCVWIRASYNTKLSCHNRVEQIQFQSIIIIKMWTHNNRKRKITNRQTPTKLEFKGQQRKKKQNQTQKLRKRPFYF